MAGTTAIGALLLGLNLVLLVPGAQAQDGLRLGGCPSSYITTFDFDARKISELIGSTGYQTAMVQGTGAEADHSCQKLQLFDGTLFSYSYMDADGEPHQVSGSYRAVPTSFRTQGFLELFGLPVGVLGANIFGIAHLYPLVSRADAHVYLSCSQLGFFHSENVYTFVPNTPSSLRGAEEVRETLALMGVPLSKTLVKSDQTCVKPEQPANDSSNDTSAVDTPTREVEASNDSTTDTLVSVTTPSGDSASDASSSDTLASDSSSGGALASDSSPSGASASNASGASPSGASFTNASSRGDSAFDASLSGGLASSDASSSDVLPSGASSNEALASVASSIDALASSALSSDASSNTAPAASSPVKDSTQRDVESNALGDGPQEASSEDVEKEPATESSVDQKQAS